MGALDAAEAFIGGEESSMNLKDAEEFTQSLGQIVSGSWRQVALADRLGVPAILGFNSTREWVVDRLGGYIKMPIDDRRDAVKELTEEGYSTREIGDVLGVDHSTIAKDRRVENPTEPGEITNDGMADNPPSVEKSTDDIEQSRKREAALREQLRISQTQAEIPDKRYGTIVIDPPWPMKKIEREVRPNQVEFDYPTMDYEQLRAFRSTFGVLAADDCHVFMWTTQKFLPMAMRLFEDYGIKYVLTMVWHKPGGFQPIGLPQYNCEFVLYGRIGSPRFADTKSFNCCFEAPRSEHSRKPDEFYDLVRRVADTNRIDIFSREKREGFEQFGNETTKFSEVA